jgi:hypothetical protein
LTLIEASGGREAKGLDLPLELSQEERFTFAQEKELLNAAAVILREFFAEFAIEGLRLLKRGEFSLEMKNR